MTDLTQSILFTSQPNLNNYVTIAAVVSSQIPIANIFNGMKLLTNLLKQIDADIQSNKTITFAQLNSQIDFKMFKPIKPKVIFAYYWSRVLPDNQQAQATVNYQPVVQFKIDYDACCVGAMMALLTTDISVRTTIPNINVNGFTANGSQTGLQVDINDVYSIQYSYITDFIYHYIERIDIGFANTGGNAPVWHQQIPSEIVKIYQTILSPPAIAITTARAIREDQFYIRHDGHRQYGRKMFQIQSPSQIPSNTTTTNTGMNFGFTQQLPSSQTSYSSQYELAMYWMDTEIMSVDIGNVTNQNSYSNQQNFQVTMKPLGNTGSTLDTKIVTDKDKTQTIIKLNLETEMYWRFGSPTSKITLVLNGVNYNMNNNMKYLKIFSSQADLAKYVYQSTNLIDQIQTTQIQNGQVQEQYFVIPTILYTTDNITFSVNLVSVLSTLGYVYNLTNASSAFIAAVSTPTVSAEVPLINTGLLTVEDNISETENNSGSMSYNLATISGLVTTPCYTTILIMQQGNVMTCTQNSFVLNQNNINMFVIGSITGGVYMPPTDFSESKILNNIIVNQVLPNANNTGFSNCLMYNENNGKLTVQDFTNKTSQALANILLQSTGAMSPLMKQGNMGYVNVVKTPYNDNDVYVNNLAMYTQSNGSILMPGGQNAVALFRYNASIYANNPNEEQYPSFENPDFYSIHTYRSSHGIVDFYLPLQFLFICQDIANSFPHYACAAQSILVKFEFNNPLTFINTSISVNPLALNKFDFAQKERLLINRVQTKDILQCNINNTRAVLFYTRYAWVPQLINLMASYKYYSWVINNYDKFVKLVRAQDAGNWVILNDFNKSNFYTRIWSLFINKETYDVVSNRGNVQLDYIPISVNKFKLEPWDVMKFSQNSTVTSGGAGLTGSDLTLYNTGQNSVFFFTPVEDIQMVTKTSVNMTDQLPYRFAHFAPMLTLEHQSIGSPLMINNLIQYNIDSVFYQEGFPYTMYSPAYAPEFSMKCLVKKTQEQDFGVIIIPEYKNITYITQHIVLLKYSTNN